MDKFEDLRTFVAVVQVGTFNGAADRLGIVKSAVSRRIRELEERLGSQLFARTTRQVALTEAGRIYHDQAATVLAMLDSMDEAIRSQTQAPSGLLRVTGPAGVYTNYVAAAAARYRRAHPLVEIEIEATDRSVDIVAEGFDLAIRVGRLKDSALIARKTGGLEMVVCASPEYFERRGRPATLADLIGHDGIGLLGADSQEQWSFTDGEIATPRTMLRLNNVDMIRHAALAGGGVAFLPFCIVSDDLGTGLLETVLAEHSGKPVDIYAVYPAARHLPARVRGFIDFLAAEVAASASQRTDR